MRPHALRCTAFGPFAGTVEVDLDLLAANGLFLLHGDTGAGKTTLLDALGFALYGAVPGERGKAGRLRSDHAPPELRTEVRLEVTLGGRRLRITRSPQQARAKRGGGTTTEPAKVLLEERVGGAWTTVSTRIAEAADEVLGLLGMSAEQFFQVVLLPQGEFAAFLTARSDKRGELLERLFGTERFGAVEDWLARRRVACSGEVAAARSRVQLCAARVAQAAGVDEPDPSGLEPARPESTRGEPVMAAPAWAEGLRDQAAAQAASTERVVDERVARQRAARAAAEAATALSTAQRRRAELLRRGEQLALAGPRLAPLRDELAAATRAVEVAAVLAQTAQRTADTARARDRVVRARAALAPLRADGVDAPPPYEDGLDALHALAAAGRERTGRLEGLRPVAGEVASAERVEQAARAAAAQARRELSAVELALAGLPARRAALASAVAAGREAQSQLPGAQAALTGLLAAVADEQRLEALARTAAGLRDELLLARETAVALRDKAADVREARLDDVRFELASMLVDGVPCEVCGSTFHPDPSQVRGERVTREDEDLARSRAEQAQREVEELSGQLAAVEAEAAVVEPRRGALSGPRLRSAVTDAEAAVGRLGPLAGGLTAAERAAADLEHEQAAGERSRTLLTATVGEQERRADEAAARAADGRALVAQHLRGAPDLDHALRRARALVDAVEGVVEAERELRSCQHEEREAAAAAATAARAAGFPDAAAAAQAARPADWRADAQRRLRRHDDDVAAQVAALAAPELQVALTPPADVTAAAQALAAADEAVSTAQAERATAAARAGDLAALVPRLVAAVDDLEPVLERARTVRSLADLCAGGGANQLKMTLSSFVLAARLEEVAAAASVRLLRMSQGRYSLVHTDGAARGGARSGLGLLARDSWTGQDRATSTLSGGETFLASLALALGLADVVQAEAGGTRIEALFVDEGFGTLDEDTLDEVMDVLDGLREGGRVVGLVSHVATLRARVPAQVHVRKTRSGSDVVLTGC